MTWTKGQEPLRSPETALQHAAERLANQFTGMVGAETVERVVFESYIALARTATVTLHLPTLAEKFSRERLVALAQSRGFIAKSVPEVLYVCVQNSGRSQMAAAITRHLAGGRVHVRSAGSQPAEEIVPTVVRVLAEIGIPVDDEFPKPLTDDVVRAADAVVTMGCGDACPIYPGKRYLDWDLTDPAGLSIEEVREIRDDVQRRVELLLSELTPAHA